MCLTSCQQVTWITLVQEIYFKSRQQISKMNNTSITMCLIRWQQVSRMNNTSITMCLTRWQQVSRMNNTSITMCLTSMQQVQWRKKHTSLTDNNYVLCSIESSMNRSIRQAASKMSCILYCDIVSSEQRWTRRNKLDVRSISIFFLIWVKVDGSVVIGSNIGLFNSAVEYKNASFFNQRICWLQVWRKITSVINY